MFTQLLTLVWWKAAVIRGLRTAVVVAVPYVPASYVGSIPYTALASAAGLAFLASLIMSLGGLPEVAGQSQPWYYAILARVTKTVAQAVAAGFGTAVFLGDVNWTSIGQLALTAGFGSLLLAVLKVLPESGAPTVPAPPAVATINVTPSISASTASTAPSSAVTVVPVATEDDDTPGRHVATE